MHLPVLVREVIGNLSPEPGDVIFDGTLGGGGHAREIIKRIAPGGRLIGVDRDPEAVDRIIQIFGDRGIFVNDDFRNVDRILTEVGVEKIDGAVFDLGLSSYQIDDQRRGFSFLKDGPLDMRFDKRQSLSAEKVVNEFGKEELAEIISKYGEERHARIVARAICSERRKKRISTTGDLVDVIRRAVGRKYTRQRIHPAARTFQAIRIFVNEELVSVEEGVGKTLTFLSPGARICVISFHSLEDRIVKNIFRDSARAGELRRVNKKPIRPGREEVAANPRSRSAKLRVAEKIS
ncbi:MAG: 16S rRNA (cytosine(1402)-N(4))-methyltransferase RsmH [Candidatus Omnitrophica bacterium]|nr:16S rRNA (cytosine(1402)-N(4))-methyltransferase RsmH [Candidatus Omnitrophota bacterium]